MAVNTFMRRNNDCLELLIKIKYSKKWNNNFVNENNELPVGYMANLCKCYIEPSRQR